DLGVKRVAFPLDNTAMIKLTGSVPSITTLVHEKGIVTMRRPFFHLPPVTESDSAPPLWLGANFWSRSGGPRLWSNYDPDLVREELAVLQEHGLTMTRSFFYWPDFHPEPYRLDEACIARFDDFLAAHRELGMTTVPTFIVGHMSGEN